MKCLGSFPTRCRRLRCCSKASGASGERAAGTGRFPRRNWVVVILMRVLINLIFVLPLPSMHQFITNPSASSSSESEEVSPLVWPGMDQSESFYAWVVSGFSIGAVTGSIGAAPLLKLFPYRYCFLFSFSLGIFGNILYALADPSRAWFVLVGRLLTGVTFGLVISLQLAYIGETAIEDIARPQNTKPRKTLKDKLYLSYSFVNASSYMFGPAIGAIMSQFPSVDPYRWSAWFSAALITAFMAVFLTVYKEEWKCNQCKCRGSFTCGRGPLQSPWGLKNWLLFLFLTVCNYILNSNYVVLDALVNPILSDYFGFTVEDSSYFMLCSLAVMIGGSILLFILMELKIKTRKILALAICFMITGLAIMGDWQGIGHDPCLAASPHNFSFTSNTTMLSVHANANSTKSMQEWNTGSGSLESLDREMLQASHCEAQSSSGHDCYWNPVSRVTGKLCKDCDPVCRSAQKSLNFVQFALGVTLLTSTIPVATITTSLVTTQFLPLELQGTLMSVITAAGGFSRIISPLWNDKLYESTGKHTYPLVGIMIVILAVILAGICAFYKQLAPRPPQNGTHIPLREELELNSFDDQGDDDSSIEKGDKIGLCNVDKISSQENDDSDSTTSVHIDVGDKELSTESAPLLNEGETTSISTVSEELMDVKIDG